MQNHLNQYPKDMFGVTSITSKAFNSYDLTSEALNKELSIILKEDRNRQVVPAFSENLEGNRHSAEYNFIGFPSKKPYEPIEKYVKHFTLADDVILDPFCGSGGVALVASQLGRHAICIDASPLACQITKSYSTKVDPGAIRQAFQILEKALNANRKALYGTTCHLSNKQVEIDTMIWSETTRCIKCFEVIAIADLKDQACPKCGNIIKNRYERLGPIPWGAIYNLPGQGDILRTTSDTKIEAKTAFDKYDFPPAKLNGWNPADKGFTDRPLMNHQGSGPWGVLWRPYHGDVRTVGGFFTKRNLWALCDIRNAIDSINSGDEIKQLLRLALASVIHLASRQQRYYPGSTFPNMTMPGVLFFPAVHEEVNVYKRFFSKQRSLIRGQIAVNDRLGEGKVFVIQGSANKLEYIPTESIDYVFTDPPYSGRIQYGELLFLQEAILDLDTSWLSEELIVNEVRGIDLDLWALKLEQCMMEIYRVLKPGRWASICFHDSNPASWVKLQNAMLNVGFIPGPADQANSMQTGWQTLKMHTSEDITKRDLVVNFYKPKSGEMNSTIAISGEEDKITFTEKVRQIICDFLEAHPGTTSDRIYDEVVSRMVHRGQLEEHDFNAILKQVATEVKTPVKKSLFEKKDTDLFGGHEIKRWYLKETELAITDAAETAREDTAAENLGAFMKGYLSKHVGEEGVHYSDIFEHFIYAIKDKPRRHLTEFLPDYFYKTDQGTWRLPDSEEEELAKREARVKGLGRRVKRYIAQLEQGVIIPEQERPSDATLAEWIRHCKRAGLYEQGKYLYEKGGINLDNLTDEVMASVEEDYQVCARMLARASG